MDPTSSTVLITGGATGIEFALAERLVRCGSDVVICGRARTPFATHNGEELDALSARMAQ